MAGWIIDTSADGFITGSATIHNNSGIFTYDSMLCPGTPDKCATNTKYYVKAKIEEDSTNFDSFESSFGEIMKEMVGNSCCQEGFTVWFSASSNSSYNKVCNNTSSFDVKNIDECDHVVFNTNSHLYGGKHSFQSSAYTDSGFPYIDNGSGTAKYLNNGSYAGHKFRYRTSSNEIPQGCFSGITAVREVYFPKYTSGDSGTTITTIGAGAFSACTGLSAITLNAVETIGTSAFENCTGLKTIDWAHKGCNDTSVVKTINGSAFKNCSGLTAVNIPNSVTTLGNAAFRYCSGATSLTIGNGITSIPATCFADMKGITNVTIPTGVTSIGNTAFNNCSSLTSVTFNNRLSTIGDNCFSGCISLKSISLPQSVTNVGTSAFKGCTSLTAVSISSMATINNSAFSGCTDLSYISLGPSITSTTNFSSCFSFSNVKGSVGGTDYTVTLNYNGVVQGLLTTFATTREQFNDLVYFEVPSNQLANYKSAYPSSTRPSGWSFMAM